MLHEMGERLFEWIKKERSNGACLSGKVIRCKAVELNHKILDFKASNR